MKIKIVPYNELYARVDAEVAILRELTTVFQFRPQGFKFMPTYKAGIWDGFIRLFNYSEKLIPIGLLPPLFDYANTNGYTVAFAGSPLHTFKGVEVMLSNWGDFCAFKPHDYQCKATIQALGLNKALILSPTGSGKSFIMYMILSYLIKYTKYNILITVPNIQLVEQLAQDIADYEIDTNRMSQHIHTIYGSQEKHTNKRIVISTWQSMIKQEPAYFNRFQAYICDEAHQADGKSITKIINNLQFTSKVRIGLTGTLDGTVCHEMQLRSLFGPVVKTKTTKELMKEGYLSKLVVDVRILMHSDKIPPKLDYIEEVELLTQSPARNKYIIDTAMGCDHNTLVLFNFVASHGKVLYNMACDIAKQYGKEVYYISGEVSVEEREIIRKKFASQSNVILFASLGTFSAGINAPNIRYLIMAHPSKSRIRNLQSIGRSLRKSEGKEQAVLIDIADDIYPKRKKKSHTYNHLIERLKIYEAEQFEYTVKEVHI